MIIDLTGMELANASLLDESTAAAEAMTLLYDVRSRDQKKNKINKFFVSKNIFPLLFKLQIIDNLVEELVIEDELNFNFDSNEFYGAFIQYPSANGEVTDSSEFIKKCNDNNIKIAVAADILSLTILESPGKFGAVCGWSYCWNSFRLRNGTFRCNCSKRNIQKKYSWKNYWSDSRY